MYRLQQADDVDGLFGFTTRVHVSQHRAQNGATVLGSETATDRGCC